MRPQQARSEDPSFRSTDGLSAPDTQSLGWPCQTPDLGSSLQKKGGRVSSRRFFVTTRRTTLGLAQRHHQSHLTRACLSETLESREAPREMMCPSSSFPSRSLRSPRPPRPRGGGFLYAPGKRAVKTTRPEAQVARPDGQQRSGNTPSITSAGATLRI